MGESGNACVMQPFSYVSVIPNEPNEGNQPHALGQSISFGRFMTEPLDWEKWSTFSSKSYVEEAERYAKPGSVAQKKAFFEAHYKNLAARKAAALLEQGNSTKESVSEPESESGIKTQNPETVISSPEMVINETEEDKAPEKIEAFSYNANGSNSNVETVDLVTEKPVDLDKKAEKIEILSRVWDFDDNKKMKEPEPTNEISEKEQSTKVNEEVSELRRKKKTTLYPSKSIMNQRTSKLSSPSKSIAPNNATPKNGRAATAIDSAHKIKPTPKSLNISVNFTPMKELNKLTSTVMKKIENSKAPKDCPTPLKTPTQVPKNKGHQYCSTTPYSEKKRTTTLLNPLASGSRTTAKEKWRMLTTDCSKFLSACKNKARSPFSATPFCLRTEERAAIRKKKLEEKFNAHETEKVKDKVETENDKQRPNLCFKARPLPNFYRQRKAPKNETNMIPPNRLQPTALRKDEKTSKFNIQKPMAIMNNSGLRFIKGKNTPTAPACLLLQTTKKARENTSPNIQL